MMFDVQALVIRDKHQQELRSLISLESQAAREKYFLMSDDGEFIIINQDVDYAGDTIPIGTLGYAYPNRHEQFFGASIWCVECAACLDDGWSYDLTPDTFDVITYEEYKARSSSPKYVQVVVSEPVVKGDVIYLK